MTRVVILDDYQSVAASAADWRSDELGLELDFRHGVLRGDALLHALDGAEVVVAMRERTAFDAGLLAQLPALRLLVTTGMTNAAIDLEAAERLGIVVCGTRGLTSAAVEHTWALILALVRNLVAEDGALRAGKWQSTIGLGLRGRTLGILGLGRYGGEVASIGRAFGMQVLAWSANLTDEAAAERGATRVGKRELFARSDVVSVHYRLSARSTGIVGAEEIAAMRPTAYLVNTARGELVDTGALVTALESGLIAGAGIDVFAHEPICADEPLLRAPRTVLTPHLGYVTDDNYSFFYTDAVKAIAAFLAGAPIRRLSGDSTPRRHP